jgi:hypothetical protein
LTAQGNLPLGIPLHITSPIKNSLRSHPSQIFQRGGRERTLPGSRKYGKVSRRGNLALPPPSRRKR